MNQADNCEFESLANMRLKPTYIFLRSGCLFCYRGIFSGLSNETMGAALYQYIPLQVCNTTLQGIGTINSAPNNPSFNPSFAVKYTACLFNLLAAYHSNCKYLLCINTSYPLVLLHAMVHTKHTTMKAIHSTTELAYAYYHPLLQRYARRLIHNAAVAEILVTQVLKDQYAIDELAPRTQLRNVLKTDLLNRCHYWRQSILFDRPPVKVPPFRLIKNDDKKNHPIN